MLQEDSKNFKQIKERNGEKRGKPQLCKTSPVEMQWVGKLYTLLYRFIDYHNVFSFDSV